MPSWRLDNGRKRVGENLRGACSSERKILRDKTEQFKPSNIVKWRNVQQLVSYAVYRVLVTISRSAKKGRPRLSQETKSALFSRP